MKTFLVHMTINAENPSDARELLKDYTGQETSIQILTVMEADNDD
jgi:hypothetical protein